MWQNHRMLYDKNHYDKSGNTLSALQIMAEECELNAESRIQNYTFTGVWCRTTCTDTRCIAVTMAMITVLR